MKCRMTESLSYSVEQRYVVGKKLGRSWALRERRRKISRPSVKVKVLGGAGEKERESNRRKQVSFMHLPHAADGWWMNIVVLKC
jgi:hypothetical protein